MRHARIGLALLLLSLSSSACTGGGSSGDPDTPAPDAAAPDDAAAADGGSSEDDAGADPDPDPDAATSSAPAVVATVPADQASGVEPGATIEVTFSRDMAADTIDASTIVVSRGDAVVPGTVSYDASTRTARFTPTPRMALLAEHTVTVTTGVTDVDGVPLPAERASIFTVRDGAWRAARLLLDAPEGGAPSPQVAIGAGDALVVWEQGGAVWSAAHVLDTGWETAAVFAETASRPELAISASDHGAVIFDRALAPDAPISLLARSRAPGGAWGEPVAVESDEAYAHHVGMLPHVAVDPSGNATAVWDQYDDVGRNVWAARRAPGGGWDAPVLLETEAADESVNPWVVADAAGNVTVAWMQGDITQWRIWARRYAPAAGWGAAAPLTTVEGEFASRVRLVADAAGNVTAVWAQHDGTRDSVWSNRHVAGAGWGTATLLETSDGLTLGAEVAADAAGNVTAVWSQRGDAGFEVWSRRFVPGAGWDTATRVAAGAQPDVVADPAGNVIVVWETAADGIVSLWARRFVPGAGWGTATRIDTTEVGDSIFADAAIGPLGNAVVTWGRSVGASQSGSDWQVWAAAFE